MDRKSAIGCDDFFLNKNHFYLSIYLSQSNISTVHFASKHCMITLSKDADVTDGILRQAIDALFAISIWILIRRSAKPDSAEGVSSRLLFMI